MNLSEQLNKRCKLGGKIPFTNELGEQDIKDGIIKELVYCSILPQSAIKSNTPVTEGYNFTHKFKIRRKSISEPKLDMFFLFKNQKFYFKYWDSDYKNNEFLDIFTELKLE